MSVSLSLFEALLTKEISFGPGQTVVYRQSKRQCGTRGVGAKDFLQWGVRLDGLTFGFDGRVSGRVQAECGGANLCVESLLV